MPTLQERRTAAKEDRKTISRVVNGRNFTFDEGTRYVCHRQTGEMRAANDVFLNHSDWDEFDPIKNEFLTNVKGATPAQLQEYEALKAAHADLLAEHEELQDRWRTTVDSKLELESKYADLEREYKALRGATNDMSDEDLPDIKELEDLIEASLTQKTGRRQLARKVVSVFQSPRALLTASETDLMAIPGLGPAKAKQIHEALHAAPSADPEVDEE